MLPLLILPKPTNPASMQIHTAFVLLYLINYILERKPCSICVIVFLTAVGLTCYSGSGGCLWSDCTDQVCES